jgi:hypothetical protein
MTNLSKAGRRVPPPQFYATRHPLIPIGTRFGRWEVLENNITLDYRGEARRACLVRCECGTEKVRVYFTLRNGHSTSCGCRCRERSRESAWSRLLTATACRNKDFHLTLPQLKKVSQLPCAYCGKKPSNVFRVRYTVKGSEKRMVDPSMEIRYSGMDRIDSRLGYIEGNVVPCCATCNIAKNVLGLEDFFALIARIHMHATVAGVRELATTIFHHIP